MFSIFETVKTFSIAVILFAIEKCRILMRHNNLIRNFY